MANSMTHKIPSTHMGRPYFIHRNDGNQQCQKPMVIWADPPVYRMCAWCGWTEKYSLENKI